MSSSVTPSPKRLSPAQLQAVGVLLFLCIPLVLFLFVAHPRPVAASLAAGVVLMVGHRFLARPYMRRALARKCLWCNRVLSPGEAGLPLDLDTAGGSFTAMCCAGHAEPAARFFAFVEGWRWPLRLGIFVPLLLLLGALAATAFGFAVPLEGATALFRLGVGLTVNLAALGYLWTTPAGVPTVPFPLHNFFLLGVRILLWIFRLMGLWWIVLGLRFFVTR